MRRRRARRLRHGDLGGQRECALATAGRTRPPARLLARPSVRPATSASETTGAARRAGWVGAAVSAPPALGCGGVVPPLPLGGRRVEEEVYGRNPLRLRIIPALPQVQDM